MEKDHFKFGCSFSLSFFLFFLLPLTFFFIYFFSSDPLDTIKVRLQTNPALYSSTTSCIRTTFHREGLRGFYSGMSSPLAGEAFFNAVQFFAYGQSKQIALQLSGNGDRQRELTVGEYFVAGAVTGFASTFVECPIGK